jgi:hypothetical protein
MYPKMKNPRSREKNDIVKPHRNKRCLEQKKTVPPKG